jgi:hypothetical protein
MTEFLKTTKEMVERMEAERKDGHEKMMAKLVAHQAKMDAAHEEMMARRRAWRKDMKAGQETTKARLECKERTSETWNPERSIRKSLRNMPQWKLANSQ